MITVYIYSGLPRLYDGKLDWAPEKKEFSIPISAGIRVGFAKRPAKGELGQLCLCLPLPDGTVEVTTLKLCVGLFTCLCIREELFGRAVRRVLLQELLDEGPLRLESTCRIEAG